VRLSVVDHPDHGIMAFGTANAVLLVALLAGSGISHINGFGSLGGLQLAEFKFVKPEALALLAAIDLYGVNRNRFHVRLAFGALHVSLPFL
jgi:hypothetical protein